MTEEEVLVKMIKVFTEFPFAQICKHWVVLQVLQALEIRNLSDPVTLDRLAKAAVQSNDEEILKIVKEISSKERRIE